jgi:hypothetical protein
MSSSPGPERYLDFGEGITIETAWTQYVNNLKESDRPESLQAMLRSLAFFEAALGGPLFRVTTPLLDDLAFVLVDLVFSSTFVVHANIQSRACRLLLSVLQKLSRKHDTTFSIRFERVFDFFSEFLRWRAVRQIRYARLDPYYDAVLALRRFFPAEDSDQILDRWYDQIGFCDTKSILPLVYLTIFLPFSALPRVLDAFVRILDDFPFAILSLRILTYIGRAARSAQFVTEPIDWFPYLDRIFLAILRSLQPTVSIGGKRAQLIDRNRQSSELNFCYFGNYQEQTMDGCYAPIAALLIDGPLGEAVVLRVKRLMGLLQPLIGSPAEKTVGGFVAHLVFSAWGHARESSSWKRAGVPYHPRSPVVLAPFAAAVFPFIKSLLFSQQQKEALQTLQVLVGFNYSLARDDLYPFALANMVNYEMVEFAASCGRIVAALVQSMFESEHLQENIGLLAETIEIASENALSGAPGVRGAAFSILKAVGSLVCTGEEQSQIGVLMASKFRSFFGAVLALYALNAQVGDTVKGTPSKVLTSDYLAGFGTEFIGNQLEWIFDTLAETDPRSRAPGVFGSMAAAHRALIPRLVKEIIARIARAGDAAAKFWRCALGAVLVPAPELLDVFKDVVRVISETIATDEKGRFESAHVIAEKLAEAATGVGWLRLRGESIPGELAKLKDITPDLYRLPEHGVVDIGEALYAAYRPALEEFPTLRLKEQLGAVRVLRAFGRLFSIRGNFGTGIPRPLPPGLDAILMHLIEHIRDWLTHELNSELVKEIIDSSCALMLDTPRMQKIRRIRVLKWVDRKWTFLEVPIQTIPLCAAKQFAVSTFAVPEPTPVIEAFIREIVFPLVYHDFWQIREAAIRYLARVNINAAPSLFAALSDQNFETLERADKTEAEFYGALRFITVCVQTTVSDPVRLTRCMRALYTMTFDPEWKVDLVIKGVMGALENARIFLRHATHLAPDFTALQRSLPTLRPGSLSEYWLRFLPYFLATGPAPCELPIFERFWRDLLSVERGRKRLVMEEFSEFVWGLRPKVPRTVVEGFPGEEYFIDNAAIGFWAEPRGTRVASGPAIEQPSEVRDWFVKTFTAEAAGELIGMFVLQREPNTGLDIRVVSLWTYLSWAIGPGLIDAVVPHLGCDDADLPSSVVRLEIAVGVSRGLRRWPTPAAEDAIERVVAPIVLRFATRDKAEIGEVMSNCFHMIVGDADFRRSKWLFDRIEGWLDGETLRIALHVLSVFSSQTHLSTQPILTKFVTEKLIPKLPPLADLPQPVIGELAELFCGVMDKGLSPNPRSDFGMFAVLFEDIIDKQNPTDNLVSFLRSLSFSRGHAGERLIPFIAARITRLFTLRTDISLQMVQTHVSFTRRLGFLPWHTHSDLLEAVLDDLIRLYQTSQWFVQEQMLHFVHGICFSQMFVVERRILRKIFDDFLILFLQNERGELRSDAVKVVRMLIPTVWDDFGDFFNEAVDKESRMVIAAANAVALVGAVIVVNRPPSWLASLLDFLTTAYRKVRIYTEMINTETAQFWKKIGSREIPEIEEFRVSFSSDYFA